MIASLLFIQATDPKFASTCHESRAKLGAGGCPFPLNLHVTNCSTAFCYATAAGLARSVQIAFSAGNAEHRMGQYSLLETIWQPFESQAQTLISITQLIIITVIIPGHGLEDNAIHPDHIGMPHAAEQSGFLDQLCNGSLPTSITPLAHATAPCQRLSCNSIALTLAGVKFDTRQACQAD